MSHFDWLVDGSIVGLYLLVVVAAGIWVRRYVGGVQDFLVAGREMDVYLGVASLAATEFGIVTCMYTAQAGYQHGFSGAVPGLLQFAAMLVIGWTGFCVKPLRESGALTLPELFEKRFGARVRWAAGLVIVLGGLLNMGLYLRLGGEFLVVVTGFDAGRLEWVMTGLLALVLVYTVLGGMLSVLVTDYVQFVVMSVGLVAVTVLVLVNVGWQPLVDAVERTHGAAGFSPLANPERGWPYLVFQALLATAATLTWQPVVARVLASKDARVGQRIYTRTSPFFLARFVLPGIWGIAALATLGPVAFEALPESLRDDPSMAAMPLYLSTALPIGLLGLLVAAMLAADMSTDSSYLLTWSSVIYNDLLAPVRKGWSESKGLFVNRLLVLAIGAFLLFYGLWFELEGSAWDYFTITGTIYLSSLSVLIVACLYWKRASRAGAIGAIAWGALCPVAFLAAQKSEVAALVESAKSIGTYWSGIAAFGGAALAMVVGSLAFPERKERA
ncbi:MAG: sodium:solute symporter family protein [Planctomycetes bacterium]|nr:sodium:solute symporter family protein [Planctomycetota bacterium]